MKKDKDPNCSETFKQTPIAVIGIGCLFPKADRLEDYWANILHGVDAITEVPKTHWHAEDYYGENARAPERLCTARGGFVSAVDFNPIEFGIPPNAIEAIDTSQLLGLVITQQALKDAGYGPGQRGFDRDRVSVIMGVTGTLELVIPLGARLGHPIWRKSLKQAGLEDAVVDEIVQRIAASYVPWQENSFPGLLGNVVAGRIAKHFDLGGTNCIIDAACASSLSALHLACLELTSGRSDMVITGGVDTFNDVFMFTCFNETQALSPSGDARPFDAQADGTILGEGLGILILKRLEDARRDQDRIYAVIRGIGASSDGKRQAIYAPSPEGQAKALKQAYRISGLTPDTVELLEAHGTGTKAGDVAELTALAQVFRPFKNEGTWCALGSVKSQIGHTKAAAGAAGIIKATMALYHKVLPPTIKVNQPVEMLISERTPFYINTQKRPWIAHKSHPRRAAVSSFGFGGSNFHCVLEEYSPEKENVDWYGHVQVLCFSGETREDLRSGLEKWPVDIPWEKLREEAKLSRTRYNEAHPNRLLLVLERGRTNIARAIANARTMLDQHAKEKSWNTPDGVYFGSGSPPGKLGVVFPGQGSQYVGMFRDLACGFPQMLQVLSQADRAFAESRTGKPVKRLSEYIYPHPVFSEEAEADHERALRATQMAQPAIGAVSLGALKVLEHFCVRPDAVAGHSYGELTALCASNRMDTGGFFSLSMLRGQLMAGGNGDKGTMLAAQASLGQVERVIQQEKLDLVIANKNAPDQMVLSGTTEEIKRAARTFERIEVRNRPIPVSGAFHSPLVAHVREPFLSALRKVDFSDSDIPVFANCTAETYPLDPDECRSILSAQLVNPVEFIKEIENMYEYGVRTFLEVGPGAKLSGLIKAILKGREVSVMSVDASSGRRSGLFDLASALAFLAVRGYKTDLTLWDDVKDKSTAHADQKRPLMTIPICGANHMNQKSGEPSLKPSRNRFSVDKSVKIAPSDRSFSADRPLSVKQAEKNSALPAADIHATPTTLAEALRMTQENMAVLQRLQEQTNQLHRQFLENQTEAQRTFQDLVEQQRQLIQACLGIMPRSDEGHQNVPVPHADPDPVRTQSSVMHVSEQSTTTKPVDVDTATTSRPVQIKQVIGHQNPSEVSLIVQADENTEIAPGPGLETGRVERTLLEVVSEKTGYPVEMLELDMELDSDLGIDSIKRVEILSDLQEKLPEAPVVKPEHLGSLKTLRHIAQFLSGPSQAPSQENFLPMEETAGSPKSDGFPVSDVGPAKLPDFAEGSVQGFAGQVSEEPSISVNGIERSVLSPVKLGETAHRQGFSISKGSRIWITDEDTGLATGIKERLISMNYRAELVSFEDLDNTLPPAELGGLVILACAINTGDGFLKDSFRLLKHAGPGLRKAGRNGGAVLMTVSRMDGCFGLTSLNGQNDPASAGIAGILKTARHEWPEVQCKALDLAEDLKDVTDAVRTIVEEMFLLGPVEVGVSRNGRYTLELSPVPFEGPAVIENPPVKKGDVVVITGGGRGITAEVAIALAAAFKPTLVLLGRSKEPGPEPEWLAPLTDEAEIKKQLLVCANGDSSPKQIEERYGAITASRELVRNMARIESAGARAIYHSVDVRDTEKVVSVFTEIRSQAGPIKGLIHGAGVIADRLIEEKTVDQFDQVYSTKVSGLRALLKASEQDDLKILVLFSSYTGRYGRSGQVDYAAANEVLNKFAQQQARQRPGCRVVSVNWGPWDGGMVNASLRKIFEQEGVGLISLEAGADYLVQEICSNGDRPAEVVVMGKKPENFQKDGAHKALSPLTTAFERELNVENYPFLRSHVMNDRSVLPMVIIIEWMAHGAMHGNPGLKFAGFDNLRILKGLILEKEETRTIRILSGKAVRNGATRMVPVELTSASGNGRDYVHARAEILLATRLPERDIPGTEIPLKPYPHGVEEIYDTGRLFHGPDFRGLKRIEGCSEQGISATAKPAPLPSAWIRSPLRNTWLTDPLVLDSSFQMMVLWSLEKNGVGSLPSFAGRYRQFQPAYPKDGARIDIRVTRHSEHKALADIDFVDPLDNTLIARMEGYECVMDTSLNSAFRRNRLPAQDGVNAIV